MNTTDEIVSIIKSATPVEMICIHALMKIVAPDSPPYTPENSRGELKKAIKRFRIAQHHPNCTPETYEAFEQAVAYIRREWLHR